MSFDVRLKLEIDEIADCLRVFVESNERFPNRHDGPISPTRPYVTWGQVMSSLNMATRGLPKSSITMIAREYKISKPTKTH